MHISIRKIHGCAWLKFIRIMADVAIWMWCGKSRLYYAGIRWSRVYPARPMRNGNYGISLSMLRRYNACLPLCNNIKCTHTDRCWQQQKHRVLTEDSSFLKIKWKRTTSPRSSLISQFKSPLIEPNNVLCARPTHAPLCKAFPLLLHFANTSSVSNTTSSGKPQLDGKSIPLHFIW